MASTVRNDTTPEGGDSADSFPIIYRDPLPDTPPLATPVCPEKKNKKAAVATAPRTLPTKGIFSSLSSAKILEQSPSMSTGKHEIQPGAWSDAVPHKFYSREGPTHRDEALSFSATPAAQTPSQAAHPADARTPSTAVTPASPGEVLFTAHTPGIQQDCAAQASVTRRSASPPQPPVEGLTKCGGGGSSVRQPTRSPLQSPPNDTSVETRTHLAPPPAQPVPSGGEHEPCVTPERRVPEASEDVDEQQLPSPLRSTAASRRRSVSVRADVAEMRHRTPSPPGMAFPRPSGFFDEPPEVNEARDAPSDEDCAEPATRPKGFDKYEEEGRRKREALESREEEEARRASEEFTFKPAISAVAQRRKTAENFDAFLAQQAQKQQVAEERHRRLSQAVLEKEEEARKDVFVNAHSQRLLSKRARRRAEKTGEAHQDPSRHDGPRLSIVDRLEEVVTMQRENRERLIRETQPIFKPLLATRGSRASSAAAKKGVHGTEASALRLTDGQETGKQSPDRDASGSEKRKKDKYAYFTSLYERTVAQKEATRAKLERIKELEAEEAAPKSQRRLTSAEAQALVAAIESREAERKMRWEKKLEQAAAAQEAETPCRPHLSTKTEKLAQRAKSRWALEEQQRKAALEEARRKEAERPLHVKTADTRSAAFEQHQTQSLDRRSRRVAQLREQRLAEELRECTFRPRLSPETERIAERFSVEPTVLELAPSDPNADYLHADDSLAGDTEFGVGRVVRSSSKRQSPLKEDPRLSSHDGISPLFDPDRRRLLREIHRDPAATPGRDAQTPADSPAPRVPPASRVHGDASLPFASLQAQPQPRAAFSIDSDGSLQSHIQSLEAVLSEWQSLERELSSTPPLHAATSRSY